MKVLDVQLRAPLAVVPIGDRLYKAAHDNGIALVTDEGVFAFDFKADVTSNYRSGGPVVDRFIDQVVSEKVGPIWWFHDLCYTPCAALDGQHPVSRKLADELLRAALLWAGMPKWKANVVYYAVRAFGASAYNNDDALTSYNSKRFSFEWRAS